MTLIKTIKVFKIVTSSKECYLLSFEELFLTAITKPPEVMVNTFFYQFSSSKEHSVRAYLDTIIYDLDDKLY